MHEWALAESVLFSVMDISKKEGISKVKEITISLGELQQIDREVFRLALKDIMKNKKVDFDIKIEVDKSLLSCRSCGEKWVFDLKDLSEKYREPVHFIPEVSHSYIRCPSCGSPDFKILRGRGVWLKSIKGD